VVERGTGGFFDTLKGMFTGQGAVASGTTDTLVKMGMPDYEAQHYQRELDAGHVLVLMNADDRPEEAFRVMRENGAFDINSRLRLDFSNGSAQPGRNYQPQATPVPAPGNSIPPAAPYANMPPAPLGTRQQATSYSNAPDAAQSAPQPTVPPDEAPEEEQAPVNNTPAPNNLQEAP